MSADTRNGLTYFQWLNQAQVLPPGFANSTESFEHWNQGNDLGWAIYCWNKKYCLQGQYRGILGGGGVS